MVTTIDDLIALLGPPADGYAADKEKFKDKLSALLGRVCGSMKSYAKANNNLTLHAQVNFAKSDFFKLRDAVLVNLANVVYNIAQDNAAALADYGWTSTKLNEIRTTLDSFIAAKPKPRTRITTNKGYNSQIIQKVNEANAFLNEQLDEAALMYEDLDPVFFDIYFNARRNYQTGVRHRQEQEILQLLGEESDTGTGENTAAPPVATENGTPVEA
jgi:hypothetical protein